MSKNLKSSGMITMMIEAMMLPLKEAMPPTITIVNTRIISVKVKEDGSM